MPNLLLPFALNACNDIINIDNAVKGEKYTCPSCGAELVLRQSKIPAGQKYHKTSHFAHKGGTDNHCSETFLHKLFKDKVAEFIQSNIEKHEPIIFEWECKQCYEHHKGNLLKKAVSVVEEYDLGECRPDVALLDASGNVVIAIEVVVTHEPEKSVLEFYDSHKIACLQLKIENFDDLTKVEEKLTHPTSVNLCPTPTCEKCGNKKDHIFLETYIGPCWKCGCDMKIAVISSNTSSLEFEDMPSAVLDKARSLGVKLENRYSKTVGASYIANVCPHCNSMTGDFYLHEFTMEGNPTDSIDLGYICGHCINEDKMRVAQEQMKIAEKRDQKLRELMMEDRKCPQCGNGLRIRNGKNGVFWGCSHYPECRYTEGIDIDAF